jgi:single-stranded-DNA-specific exonuclease
MAGSAVRAVAGAAEAGREFAAAVARFDRSRPALVLGHFDADGLAASAILARSLEGFGIAAETRIVGKGENPWREKLRRELGERRPGGLIVADLGTREGSLLPGTATVVIDHHVPTGMPEAATVISGHGLSPEPSSALLAWWCAGAIGPADTLLWLTAVGLIGDMASGLPELEQAERRYGKTALKKAVALINAPRRTAKADASPALALLLKCNSPAELVDGGHPETEALRAAQDEVRGEMEAVKRTAPKIRGDVALLPFASPAQVHPLLAQQWRSRLRDKVVIAANRAYRPGWVHFAARIASGRDLIQFLADHRPAGADENYGNGHRQATGGALRYPDWNRFIAALGFPEEQIA